MSDKVSKKMAQIATDQQAVTLDELGRVLSPPPPAKKRPKHIKLETVRDVRNELARVYRAARAGDIPPEVASRFTFMLGTLGKLIVDSEIEQRIAELEQSQSELLEK